MNNDPVTEFLFHARHCDVAGDGRCTCGRDEAHYHYESVVAERDRLRAERDQLRWEVQICRGDTETEVSLAYREERDRLRLDVEDLHKIKADLEIANGEARRQFRLNLQLREAAQCAVTLLDGITHPDHGTTEAAYVLRKALDARDDK
jgi:hypothetical protein